MRMLKTTAPIIRAIPRSKPKILAVRMIAKILIAGLDALIEGRIGRTEMSQLKSKF